MDRVRRLSEAGASMFNIIVLLVLAVLATPIVAVAALMSANGLRREVRELASRVHLLERDRQPARAPDAIARAAIQSPASIQPPPAEPVPPPASPPPVTSTSVPSSAAPPEVPLTPPAIGFEERFGTRWVVWVGGVALALGGIFLVRYTIEQGLIGPGVRIFLALCWRLR